MFEGKIIVSDRGQSNCLAVDGDCEAAVAVERSAVPKGQSQLV